MEQQETPFQALWVAMRLPGYRESRDCTFDELPPLPIDSGKPKFQWIYDIDAHILLNDFDEDQIFDVESEIQERLTSLQMAAQREHLTLPSAFLEFLCLPNTAKYTPSSLILELSEDIVQSSLFSGLYFIKFVASRGEGLCWYLCMNKSGSHCIVASYHGLDDDRPLERWDASGGKLDLATLLKETFFCAHDFGGFIYRLWFECDLRKRLWGQLPQSRAQTAYLAFYTARTHT